MSHSLVRYDSFDVAKVLFILLKKGPRALHLGRLDIVIFAHDKGEQAEVLFNHVTLVT